MNLDAGFIVNSAEEKRKKMILFLFLLFFAYENLLLGKVVLNICYHES
jgi:hypothetical protein